MDAKKVAVLIESWGEPWNEGYKNLARYIVEMLSDSVNINVIPADKVKFSSLENFDLIHIFNYTIPLHLFVRFARVKKPIVKHIAKKEVDINVKSFARTLLNTRFVWDAFIATTDILAEEVRRLVRDKPVFYLPPPIPTDFFKKLDKDECRELLGLKNDEIYIGYTGTLNRFRNLGLILKALRLINDKRKEKIKFILSLTNVKPEELAQLKEYLNMNQIKLLTVKDVRLIYSSIDALIYPVKREGAIEPPLTILEAMSCECIVVAYRNIVTSKLILDGYNGFTFSDSEDLAKIIRHLIDGRLDGRIAENARKTIVKSYDSSMLCKFYVRLYEQILDEL